MNINARDKYDKIWGIGLYEENPLAWDVKTWEGRNYLGRCLMNVREENTKYTS